MSAASYYIFLKRQKLAPSDDVAIIRDGTAALDTLYDYLNKPGELWAIDLETTGVNPVTDNILGMAIHNGEQTFYFDVKGWTPRHWEGFYNWQKDKRLVAHNATFDFAFLYQYFANQLPAIYGCSLVLFKMCANDGWTGQSWSLDTAIDTVLGWPTNNKDTLAELLEKHKLGKDTMWKLDELEPEAFAMYCAHDAQACWQLYTYLRSVATTAPLENIWDSYINLFVPQISRQIRAQARGIYTDRLRLERLRQGINAALRANYYSILSCDQAIVPLYERNSELIYKHYSPKLTQRKIKAKASDTPWLRPDVWQRDERKPTAKWEYEHGTWCKYEPVIKPSRRTTAPKQFNLSSGHQIRWLLYEKIYTDWRITRKPVPKSQWADWRGPSKRELGRFHISFGDGPDDSIETYLTKSGALPTDKNVLPRFGEIGKLLMDRSRLTKLDGYVRAALAASDNEDSVIHASMQVHGTKTGRPAAGDGSGRVSATRFNMLQQPKHKSYLQAFKARPGYTLVEIDYTSVEDVILAEMSRDKTMLELYASGKPHDGYLYVAMQIFPKETADKIAAVYYLDEARTLLTKESVAKAKAMFPKERDTAKTVKLAKNYGAGAEKIMLTLFFKAGIKMQLEDVKELCDRFDAAFEGNARYMESLLEEWNERGGWIFNVVGRPMAVAASQKKDLGNRAIQGGAHDCLLFMLNSICRRVEEAGLEDICWPWIEDFYDETIWECKTEYVPQLKAIFSDALAELNEWLGADKLIPLTGEPEHGCSLARFKIK